ncbi:RNA polymerase sigma factor [Caulobacter sp. UC70_42]|uniref:RNA polymerase sigma factor n=1 Tax=Caulobacter sp. UC70_42 TaxID=3374551 RepID=UPI0037582B0D
MDGFVPPATPSDVMSAAEALVRQYGDWLRNRLRIRYGDEAEDLAQEAIIKTAAQDASSQVRHPKAFLLAVANNLAVDRARRERRERQGHADALLMQTRSTALTTEDLLVLKDIVLALPSELRDALVLTKIKGLSYEDVAALKGWKVRTVKDRVRQALVITQAARD